MIVTSLCLFWVWRYSGYFIHHLQDISKAFKHTHAQHSTDLFTEQLLNLCNCADVCLKPSWWPWGSAGRALKEHIPLLSGATGANPGMHETQMLQMSSNYQNSELEGFRKHYFYISLIQSARFQRCISSWVQKRWASARVTVTLPYS